MRFPQFEVISLKRKLQLPYVSHHFLLGNIFRQAQISEDIFCVLPKWLAFSKSFLWFNVYSHSLGDKINEDSILVCLHHHILHTVNSGCSINIKIKWMNEPTWKKKETVFKTFRQKKKKTFRPVVLCIRITWRGCQNTDRPVSSVSHSGGPRWGLRIFISHRFPGYVMLLFQGSHVENYGLSAI